MRSKRQMSTTAKVQVTYMSVALGATLGEYLSSPNRFHKVMRRPTGT